MPYDSAWYDRYRRELELPAVRAGHDEMFRLFADFAVDADRMNILDLGCGTCEYAKYANYDSYHGVDLNHVEPGIPVSCADYRDEALLRDFGSILRPRPTVFLSLFSSELAFPVEARYQFYRRVFELIPSLQYGLVSGFYYRAHADSDVVVEPGFEERIYQTIEHPRDVRCGEFTEFRAYIPGHHEMFPPGCVEVWKFLSKN